ncbi:MAG: DNA repair protein RecN [Pseudomonadota bacterium]
MLIHLSINNFVLVENLAIDFNPNMTVLTGETGAGKSILIDALSLALGQRADAGQVRGNATSANIIAEFDLSKLPKVVHWLKENDLHQTDTCILRRAITSNARSRCFINDKPCTLATLNQLGQMLVQIHGQHAQQKLLQRDYQREMLDEYAHATESAQAVQQAYQNYRQLMQQKQALLENNLDYFKQKDYLQYQIAEIDQLDLQPGEVTQLNNQQKQLANADRILNLTQQVDAILQQQIQALPNAERSLTEINNLTVVNDNLANLLETVSVNLQEAATEINALQQQIQNDPQALIQVEAKLVKIYDLARKHQVEAEDLLEQQAQLQQDLVALEEKQTLLDMIDGKITQALTCYKDKASALSQLRQQQAKKLSTAIEKNLRLVGMKAAKCQIQVITDEANISGHGFDKVEFLFQANPGNKLASLAKIASGGELSRVSLAIQVITAKTSATPTLIFDEVDVGIGGQIAERVGKLLQTLGQSVQVLCITHLAQVAVCAQFHMCVAKITKKNNTQVILQQLSTMDKIQEIARMISGERITDATLAHAKELLEVNNTSS